MSRPQESLCTGQRLDGGAEVECVWLDGFGTQLKMREHRAHTVGRSGIDRTQMFSLLTSRRKNLHADGAAHIAANREYALAGLVHFYHNVAMSPCSLAHLA